MSGVVRRTFTKPLKRGGGIEPVLQTLRRIAQARGLRSFELRDGQLHYTVDMQQGQEDTFTIITETDEASWEILRNRVELRSFTSDYSGYLLFVDLLHVVSVQRLTPVGWLLHPQAVLWSYVGKNPAWLPQEDFLGQPMYYDTTIEKSEVVLLCAETYGAPYGEASFAYRVILEQPPFEATAL